MSFVALLSLFLTAAFATANTNDQQHWLAPFAGLYEDRLGDTVPCADSHETRFAVCSSALRNPGNAPFILHHGKPTGKVAVLFHGLSDSPFFFSSIAPFIQHSGFTVIVALSPGHGLQNADDAFLADDLADAWIQHVDEVMSFAHTLGDTVFVGGFSTGGTLATHYTLQNPDKVDGLMLFSAALKLENTLEKLESVWGIRWFARLFSEENFAESPNPYKYKTVGKYPALELISVIKKVNALKVKGAPMNVPLFAAHSMADTTTLWQGIESIIEYNQGPSTAFKIEEALDVCHADVVINQNQLREMGESLSDSPLEHKCHSPHANPKHAMMMHSLVDFLHTHTRDK